MRLEKCLSKLISIVSPTINHFTWRLEIIRPLMFYGVMANSLTDQPINIPPTNKISIRGFYIFITPINQIKVIRIF